MVAIWLDTEVCTGAFRDMKGYAEIRLYRRCRPGAPPFLCSTEPYNPSPYIRETPIEGEPTGGVLNNRQVESTRPVVYCGIAPPQALCRMDLRLVAMPSVAHPRPVCTDWKSDQLIWEKPATKVAEFSRSGNLGLK